MSAETVDIAIVGNGGAAAEAVLAARTAGYRGEVHLFADNTEPPFNPMLGTYYASGALDASLCFPYGGVDFYQRAGVSAHLGAAVSRLEPDRRRLWAGDREYSYRACLVASGAHTIVPPVPGLQPAAGGGAGDTQPADGGAATEEADADVALPAVLTLRSFNDAVRLKRAIEAARSSYPGRRPRGLVLGASFAGVKVAEVLRGAGLEVCIVERESCVLPLAAHPDCACVIEEHLEERGYTVLVGAALTRVEQTGGRLVAHLSTAAPAGAAAGATLSTEEVDLLVVCTGTRPNLGFLAAGAVEGQVGLRVDEHLRTSVPGLYAAGDVAEALDPLTGRYQIVPLWSNARRQGHVAGLNMAGVHAEYAGTLPNNVTHVGDLLFASAGSMREPDACELQSGRCGVTACAYLGGRLSGVSLVSRAAPGADEVPVGPLVNAVATGCEMVTTDADAGRAWARRIALGGRGRS